MRKALHGIYRFLPVQLVLLHFRKYQLLLLFWIILTATVTGNFASHFGASSLFLSPEYMGKINFMSMLLLGCCMAFFIMSWNITTFIIHSHRIPFLGAIRQSFVQYCINNSIIPLAFFSFYSIISIRYQWKNEHAGLGNILLMQLGFYLGVLLIIAVSFLYFFRVGRDLMKVVLSRITNPSVIREIVPYDSLDIEFDIIRANTYLTHSFKIEKISDLEDYSSRLMGTVLRRHHRNAITATIFAIIVLILLGVFMEDPHIRIPAGGSFLILFSVLLGLVGAVKYFLKTWELMGWVIICVFLSLLVRFKIFDLRSIAYGLNYHTSEQQIPKYNYDYLHQLFNPQRYEQDRLQETKRLDTWKQKDTASKPTLIILTVSGGGSRSAYWTFRTLQYLDSATHGKLFTNTVVVTGASGGMFGAAYWRSLHYETTIGKIRNQFDKKYQENIGKDLLNAIIFSFTSVDLVSPFNRKSISGYSYNKDRGYALEEELIHNTEGVLNKSLRDYQPAETRAEMPMMIINGTIVNDGRRLMICSQPLAYLTQPAYALKDSSSSAIDAVDFATFFQAQDPYNLRLTTALRMNATFPYLLPPVRMPSEPQMNIMDAGLRDNFGTEVASRYLYALKDWINSNAGEVIMLQIRDTREHEIVPPDGKNSLSNMLADPFFVIQNKWQSFQSYGQGYLRDVLPSFTQDKLHVISFEYIPEEVKKSAPLNFHITEKEKQDIWQSIYQPQNQAATQYLSELLNK